ncbi:MAG: nuclease-related domain-containing protein [Rhodoglobus sp.]
MNDDSSAGASARREYERRKAKDEARLRKEWGRLGGVAVALSAERQSTSAWATGAAGEVRVGSLLDTLRTETPTVLHDRRVPGSRANVDHLVVDSSGVWVIDAKKYKGRPERRVEGGLFRPRVEMLYVAGRNKTALVEGVQWQVQQVQKALPGVPARGFLCFVEADWGLLDSSFSIDGVDVLWPKKLASRIKDAAAGAIDVAAVTEALAAKFRMA